MEPEPALETRVWDAVLLGAGSGIRFNSKRSLPGDRDFPKQFWKMGKLPVYLHALQALLEMRCFRQIVVAVPKQYVSLTEKQTQELLPLHQYSTKILVAAGGDSRQESSRLALLALESAKANELPSRVLIHDACRPLLSPAFRRRIQQQLDNRAYAAWIPVTPIVDTLKEVENQEVKGSVDRDVIHRVQTPQVFEYAVIRSLMEKISNEMVAGDPLSLHFTDDASLCEHFGIPVGVFEGDARNIKLTYEFELEPLKLMLQNLKDEEEGEPCVPESDTTSTVLSQP